MSDGVNVSEFDSDDNNNISPDREFIQRYRIGTYDCKYSKSTNIKKNPDDLDVIHDLAVIIFYMVNETIDLLEYDRAKYLKLSEQLLLNGVKQKDNKCSHQLAIISWDFHVK